MWRTLNDEETRAREADGEAVETVSGSERIFQTLVDFGNCIRSPRSQQGFSVDDCANDGMVPRFREKGSNFQTWQRKEL